jgi:hypothetical protein
MDGEKLLENYIVENKVISSTEIMRVKKAYEKWPKTSASL